MANGYYSSAAENTSVCAPDAAIPGFISSFGRGDTASDPNSAVNPVFKQWASGYKDYIPAPAADESMIGNEAYIPFGGVPEDWRRPQDALGAVTGNGFDVCVLGDLYETQIKILDPSDPNYAANNSLDPHDPKNIQPGQVTLSFDDPICDGPGPDFVIFENSFISLGEAGVAGEIFAELAYVEVSTDGITFVRFPSVSLTDENVGPMGTVDPTNIYNLAGKHINGKEYSWGTPFNLKDIADNQAVIDGDIDLANINYVKVVDIPGSGFFYDSASELIDPNSIDPNTGTGGVNYKTDHNIFDPWVTWGSGGFDLEAVGVVNQICGDANSDGRVDLKDFLRMANRWNMYGYWPQGDFDENQFVDINDLYLLAENWLRSVDS